MGDNITAMFKFTHPVRIVVIVAIVAIISACASTGTRHDNAFQSTYADRDRDTATDVASCKNHLQAAPSNMVTGLDITDFGFLNWNIKKGELTDWQNDINELAQGKDFVVLQEAVLHPDFIQAVEGLDHWSFSPGYQAASGLTGVLTLSRVAPLARCNLQTNEPWLGTPKATSITAYGLTGSDETLIIVNIHGVNFTLGVTEFELQIAQVRQILQHHKGPIILSGDFNTWRLRRIEILNILARDLSLNPLKFKKDHRKEVFGFHLDHIYVRDLMVKDTNTRIVKSSDQNPITARFGL